MVKVTFNKRFAYNEFHIFEPGDELHLVSLAPVWQKNADAFTIDGGEKHPSGGSSTEGDKLDNPLGGNNDGGPLPPLDEIL